MLPTLFSTITNHVGLLEFRAAIALFTYQRQLNQNYSILQIRDNLQPQISDRVWDTLVALESKTPDDWEAAIERATNLIQKAALAEIENQEQFKKWIERAQEDNGEPLCLDELLDPVNSIVRPAASLGYAIDSRQGHGYDLEPGWAALEVLVFDDGNEYSMSAYIPTDKLQAVLDAEAEEFNQKKTSRSSPNFCS